MFFIFSKNKTKSKRRILLLLILRTKADLENDQESVLG